MKVNFYKIIRVCMVLMMMVFVVGNVHADIFNPDSLGTALGNQTGSTTINTAAQKVWGTVATIVQILAVAAVVIAGVRYMFASADAKADIKKQTIILIVGAVLVFGASSILKFVQTAADEII